MKKIIFLLLFIPFVGFSQEFGNYKLENAIVYNNKTVFVTNKWYKSEDGKYCFINYNKTPIGIKNAISDLKYILNTNKLDFEKPFLDNTFLSSIVQNILDYEMLNISIKEESSEVYKQWRLDNSVYATLNLKKDEYKIILLKL